MAEWRFLLIRTAVILIAGFWVFSPALNGYWLWDDGVLITQNPTVLNPAGLWKIWFDPANSLIDYFPITVCVEWIEWHLWRDSTLGYHLMSVILHLISSLLV